MTILDVESMKGNVILEMGPMNSSKSSVLVKYARALDHSRFGFAAFQAAMNKRDKNFIVADGRERVPAIVIDQKNPVEILEHIKRLDLERKVDVVLIDEGNFYNYELVNVAKELRTQDRVVVIAGLNRNFRGEPYGYMRELAFEADIVNPHTSYCNMVTNGQPCSRPAIYTVRLLKVKTGNEEDKVDFRRASDCEIILQKYYLAPYYHPTNYVEEEDEKKKKKKYKDVEYSCACSRCFHVPKQDLTLKVYRTIVDNPGIKLEKLFDAFENNPDLENIVDFFLNDEVIPRADFINGALFPKKHIISPTLPGVYIKLNL